MPDPGHPNAEELQQIADRAKHEPDCWISTRALNAKWDESWDGRVIGGRVS